MLNIFICEDNKVYRENVRKIVEDIVIIEEFDMQIALDTESPEEVLEYVKNSDISGIYFLDVDLKANLNGIQLAQKIREYDSRGFIIFVTTHAEMTYMTFIYKVEAMDYIVKDNYENLKRRVHDCIINANNKHMCKAEEKRIYSIKQGDRVLNIDYNKILFFETAPIIHRIILHCVDRQIEFYGIMKDIDSQLKDEGFCRCHTSFIVNRKNIKEIDKKNRIVYFANGEECLVSTRGLKALIK